MKNEEKYQNASIEEKKKVFSEIHNMLGGNIKTLISGAAALDKTIEQKYQKLGLNLVQGYGLTETSPVVGIGTKKYRKIGSIGKTVPSIEAKIANPNSEGIDLQIKFPNDIYYNNKKMTSYKKSIEN